MGKAIKSVWKYRGQSTCLSDYMINKELEKGELVEVLADIRLPVSMPFNAVYYSDRAVSTRIRAFIDFLSERIPAHAVPKSL